MFNKNKVSIFDVTSHIKKSRDELIDKVKCLTVEQINIIIYDIEKDLPKIVKAIKDNFRWKINSKRDDTSIYYNDHEFRVITSLNKKIITTVKGSVLVSIGFNEKDEPKYSFIISIGKSMLMGYEEIGNKTKDGIEAREIYKHILSSNYKTEYGLKLVEYHSNYDNIYIKLEVSE